MKPYREIASKNIELLQENVILKKEIDELRSIVNRLVMHLEDKVGKDYWVATEARTLLNKNPKVK